MDKWALYYTCNSHDPQIESYCRRHLDIVRGEARLVSVSREPIVFGEWNEVVDMPRGALTMHQQLLAGLERIPAGWVFLCENDVLYHPVHFQFQPVDGAVFYYNTNVWRMRYSDGHAVWTDDLQQLSGCVADRELLLEFYRARVAQILERGFDRHYEPGPKCGNWQTKNWRAPLPNIDIRHPGTWTRSKWSPSEFRNKRYAKGWAETDDVPGWGPGWVIVERIKHATLPLS